ncbi:DUF3892 domain-containing protein [Aeoliella sp. SH292]|uniref:DUF3892 domain-containing protein n=1 Tax=Aeoliella sp. SH292 TaxID=3454464 RepID=UPI003F95F8E6
MARPVQIHCINKSDRYHAYGRTTHLGGLNLDKTRWHLSQVGAIEGIEGGKWDFYVSGGVQFVWAVVAKSYYGKKYLKTECGGEQPNNLLSLPEIHK